MEWNLKIRFGKSSSQNYQKALNNCKKFSDFKPISPEQSFNEIELNREEFRQKFRQIDVLWVTIGNWKTSEILENKKPVTFEDLKSYIQALDCSEKYQKAVIQEEHCKLQYKEKGWGCKFLEAIDLGLPKNSYDYDRYTYWFQFGKFESDQEWVIDKEKICLALERETKLQNLNLCAIFKFENIEEILKTLPDKILLKGNENWEIDFEEISTGSQIEKKPMGIKPKKMGDGYGGYRIEIPLGISDEDEEELKKNNRYIPDITFADIGGIDDIVDTIREVIELPLKKPQLFSYLGVKPHKGILLYGHPGCGKTLIAKAIANEINAHFISIKGPEILSKWHGQSEENLRNIFLEGRKFQPSIIFFDEIDSIAQVRSGEESLRHDAKIVNQLLTLMDGIEDYGNICVIASTNRPELIDPALHRPGRFDYEIEVKKPTKEGCKKIFEINIRKMPVSKHFNIASFFDNLFGLSGADIAFVAREGAYNCLRRNVDLKGLINGNDDHKENLFDFEILEEDFLKALKKLKTQI
jgi:ATPase family associated with various cellular activities (AAA)